MALAVTAGGLALTGAAQVPAAADTVPSCVKTVTMKEVFGQFGVTMTNGCATEQRVLPTFKLVWSSGPQPRCHVLKPGQESTQWVTPSALPFYDQAFLGLVRC
ncbi:hypothetical protein [Streptomyces cucumeris]|uniref:hypothetical protein n=1 Tax=Streptomyces cucumeris TaxID=2962890 RepID=UPI0020C8871B|nr:hypothetical protein [Streptomyces sp. NEAU-Y11]MCP9212973.1 hypothetical protein [Streptomyces sp. NEAU-Y11]